MSKNDSKPKPQPDRGFRDTNYSTTQNQVPPDENSGDTNYFSKTCQQDPKLLLMDGATATNNTIQVVESVLLNKAHTQPASEADLDAYKRCSDEMQRPQPGGSKPAKCVVPHMFSPEQHSLSPVTGRCKREIRDIPLSCQPWRYERAEHAVRATDPAEWRPPQ